ncbi:FAD-dependent oxidoreductase [Caballeronia sp. LjRoot31]|jgi:NADPH-dependent 2,4-dienoyl-CoA reductase/sulfur reductase-like enzyme/nitrite reductase/ring-hydroxylating ferredoxin subunit|uniref:FAD-dependent oxidoreductase n=1 Tax=Caballeronia sp. LjRoot31 TaxID=3342324 RepID=UPI003ECC7BA4
MAGSMQQAARFDDLREDRGTRVSIADTAILLVRQGAQVHAFSADCPHAGAPLEQGAICNGRIVCPWHKGTFAVADGSLIEPPPLTGLQRYPVVIENGNVLVSPHAQTGPAHTPAADTRTMAVIGAGAAGAAACATLREAGFDGRLVLIGPEHGMPYDRTALSKFVLAGDMPPEKIPPLLPDDFLSTQRIERVEAYVVKLDAGTKQIHLSSNLTLDYDAALICTGGIPKPMDVPGSNLSGVFLLRSRDDAEMILASLEGARKALIVGASFIGLEVASSLRKRGMDVTVAAPGKVPLGSQFGDELGRMFQRLHEKNGVVFRMQSKVIGFLGDDIVSEAEFDNGEKLPVDVVIIGTGVRPATDFLHGVELADDGGIPVDSSMHAAPGLYAAGDIAQFPLPRSDKTLRIEHWRVAQQHARVAALNMAGGDEHYTGVPYFWTYHFGKRLEYLGHASEHDEVVIDGDLDAQAFIAYLMKDGQVAAAVACDREAPAARLAEAMRSTLTLAQARSAAAG